MRRAFYSRAVGLGFLLPAQRFRGLDRRNAGNIFWTNKWAVFRETRGNVHPSLVIQYTRNGAVSSSAQGTGSAGSQGSWPLGNASFMAGTDDLQGVIQELRLVSRKMELLVLLDEKLRQPGPSMNAGVWGKLPEELLQHVVRFLPLADVCTWRCVNRHWREVVSTMERLRSWAGTHTTAVLASGWKKSCFREDLPPQLRLSTLHLNPPPAGLPKFLGLEACATSGGLICFREVWDSRLFICNPLTRVWKELPHVVEIDRHCLDEEIHLITDADSVSFKVFRVAQVFGYKQVRFMYDSAYGDWSRVDEPPPMFQNDRSIRVCRDGLLMHFHSCGTAVVGLDLNTGVYEKCTSHPGIAYSPSAIVEHLGILYYVGLSTATKSFHLHRLCDATGQWHQLEVSSLEWLQPVCKGDYKMQVAACSTYICIGLHRRCSNQCTSCKDSASRLAAFDLIANSWSCWAEDRSFVRGSLLCFELSLRRP